MTRNRNAGDVDNFRVDFPHRREPSFQWGRLVSSLLALPGIQVLYPGVTIGNSGLIVNSANPGVGDVTNRGAVTIGRRGIAPIIILPGAASDYANAADNAIFDILGTEALIEASLKGLTVGTWYRCDSVGTGSNALISKWSTNLAADNCSYMLFQNSTTLTFRVSSGTTNYDAAIAGAVAADSTWHFACGRFDPSGDVYLNQDLDLSGSAGSAPASINNSTVDFLLGGYNAGNEFAGALSVPFVCASYLPDSYVYALFHWFRDLYGA